jgi:hypothetical protein
MSAPSEQKVAAPSSAEFRWPVVCAPCLRLHLGIQDIARLVRLLEETRAAPVSLPKACRKPGDVKSLEEHAAERGQGSIPTSPWP